MGPGTPDIATQGWLTSFHQRPADSLGRRLGLPFPGFFPKLFYLLGFTIAWSIARLPLPTLYRLSDGLGWIVFDVLGYRKRVIRENLERAFPEKSEAEREQIACAHQRYFTDLMLETFKLLGLSREELIARVEFPSRAMAATLFEQRRNFIIVLGHFGNWEWAGSAYAAHGMHIMACIYHPLSNFAFDRLMYVIRRARGIRLIRMRGTFQKLRQWAMPRRGGSRMLYSVGFISDQSARPDNAYWTTFLGQDTAVFWGTERAAREFNLPVLYASIRRPERGRYRVTLEMLCENPRDTREGEISELHTRRLERDIREQPEIWLWTHRRWKHRRPVS